MIKKTCSVSESYSFILSHSLPIDVTLAVFAVGAQSTEGWDFLYSKYQSSLSSTEKSQIEFALCTSQDPEKLRWWVMHWCPHGQEKLNDIDHYGPSVCSVSQELFILLETLQQMGTWTHTQWGCHVFKMKIFKSCVLCVTYLKYLGILLEIVLRKWGNIWCRSCRHYVNVSF